MNPDWRARYELAVDAAERAGRLALTHFPDGDSAGFAAKVEWKENFSPVSFADRQAETVLRDTLLGAFPADGFLGEESGEAPGTSGYRWIVDPIDGTRSFVRGIPLWGTLVGVEYKGQLIAGAGVMPALGHTYRALRGDGAYRGNRRLSVSSVDRLDHGLLICSTLSGFFNARREADFLELARRAQRQRALGNFYGFALVAEGAAEVMIEHGVHPWDVAALVPIVEEAGGRLTDWHGRRTIDRPDVLATNGRLHDVALQVLNGK